MGDDEQRVEKMADVVVQVAVDDDRRADLNTRRRTRRIPSASAVTVCRILWAGTKRLSIIRYIDYDYGSTRDSYKSLPTWCVMIQ